MIRINLLPRDERASRKAPALAFKAADLVVPLGAIAAALLVVIGTVLSQRTRAAQLEHSIVEVESQSRALAPQIERVNRLAQERAELDLRLGIIGRLEKTRTESVRLVDEIARCVPDHMWLTSTDQQGSTIHFEGVTYSNLVVSEFMSRLDRSSMFTGVDLEVAEHAIIDGHDVVKFRVTATVTPDTPAN
ncbi:MAG TPA: PilN domain-containing protein [Candidatus Eisenbacteria bacterium]|nr:PilN domain-containing protein [Candidatus Eisenbacteria bacterium]